ncbi:acyl-coenzyme A thioesterase 1-like [Clytia hemisphaerica]|uniref:acyl-coenzyme A thioesterase 1-like n=1 Tax=Clytia hemisphaerica TaxID=252671 RepID=UPI0034D5E0E7
MNRIIKRCFSTSFTKSNKIIASPATSHTSEKIGITGNGFKPDSPITIQSTLICPEERFDFQSYAHIYTNKDGCFDLKTNESVGGTYTGIEDMGLFWSMEKRGESYDRPTLIDGVRNLPYTFNVFEGHHSENLENLPPVASSQISRFLAQKVSRHVLKTGKFRGTVFVPEGDGPFPAVMTLFGGIKKKQVPEQYAAYLASQGFVTYAMGYFGGEGLPKTYTQEPINIEYFEEAFENLRQHELVDSNNVGVLGESKGGDIAIAMISHLPQVKAVCTLNGSVVSVGVATSYKGNTTEQIPANMFAARFLECGSVDISDCLEDPKENPNAIHQIERSKGDLLMIAGEDDMNWKSCLFTDIAKERMDKAGKTNYKIIRYPNIGHFIDPHYLPICTHAYHPLIPNRLRPYFGGSNKKFNSKEQIDAWKQVFDFFHTSLK